MLPHWGIYPLLEKWTWKLDDFVRNRSFFVKSVITLRQIAHKNVSRPLLALEKMFRRLSTRRQCFNPLRSPKMLRTPPMYHYEHHL